MTNPANNSFRLESELFKNQSKTSLILGVDEVGRGALAGPIVAACVSVRATDDMHPDVRDSKQCTAHERAELYRWIRNNHSVTLTALSASDIDRWGISYCNQEVMRRAIFRQSIKGEGSILATLIDGNLKFHIPDMFKAQWVVKGDSKSYAIGCASIVAKHVRDYVMTRIERHFPQYGLAEHKGYGTLSHLSSLKADGLSPVHRKSFCESILYPQSPLF